MPADRTPIDARSPADRTGVDARSTPDRTPTAPRSATNGAAITNDPARSRWDLRSPRGRRCRDLFRSCLRLIGDPADATRQAQCIAAAEALVLAEIAREAALTDPSDRKIDVSIKTEKAARHALDALGIEKPTDKTPMSMADALRDRGYVPSPVFDDDDEADDDSDEAVTDDGASA
jgi:hypothetical protein